MQHFFVHVATLLVLTIAEKTTTMVRPDNCLGREDPCFHGVSVSEATVRAPLVVSVSFLVSCLVYVLANGQGQRDVLRSMCRIMAAELYILLFYGLSLHLASRVAAFAANMYASVLLVWHFVLDDLHVRNLYLVEVLAILPTTILYGGAMFYGPPVAAFSTILGKPSDRCQIQAHLLGILGSSAAMQLCSFTGNMLEMVLLY